MTDIVINFTGRHCASFLLSDPVTSQAYTYTYTSLQNLVAIEITSLVHDQSSITMKFTHIILATLTAATAEACITAHAYLRNCVFDGDSLSAQVYDNGVEVCRGAKSIVFASDQTSFCIGGCKAGYSFCVTKNVGSATYKSPKYGVTMKANDKKSGQFTCGSVADRPLKGTEYEACFTDGYSDCGKFPKCKTCDFRASCS